MAALDHGILLVCRTVPRSRFRSSVLACEHNYTWHLNADRFYRCSETKRGCSAKIYVLEDGTYWMTNGHNGHLNKEHEIKLNAVKREMCIRASNSRVPFRLIFDEVREIYPDVVIGYNGNIQRSMQRARSSAQPRNPRTLDEVEALLVATPLYNRTRDGNSQFYHGRVSTATGTALIFISLSMLPVLCTSQEVACDATFATLPLLFSQMFTVHVSAYTYMFPLAYALMTEKTEALYTLVLGRIIEVLNALTGGVPATIISMIAAFEYAILNAMETTFPAGHSRGCWYHFGQAIYRKVCDEGLKQAYDERPNVQKLIKMLIALALLPVNQVDAGFLHIRQQSLILLAEETPQVRQAMHIIFEYMQTYWLDTVTPERFCVQGHSRRTNNEVESFHRWFNARCGKYHQNFWTFLEYLQKIESLTLKDFDIARAGGQIRRDQGVPQRQKDERIRHFGRQLANGQMPLGQYLEMCSSFFEPALPPPAILIPLVPALPVHLGSDEDHINSDNSSNEEENYAGHAGGVHGRGRAPRRRQVNREAQRVRRGVRRHGGVRVVGEIIEAQVDEAELRRARFLLLQEMGREFTMPQAAEILQAAAVLN